MGTKNTKNIRNTCKYIYFLYLTIFPMVFFILLNFSMGYNNSFSHFTVWMNKPSSPLSSFPLEIHFFTFLYPFFTQLIRLLQREIRLRVSLLPTFSTYVCDLGALSKSWLYMRSEEIVTVRDCHLQGSDLARVVIWLSAWHVRV